MAEVSAAMAGFQACFATLSEQLAAENAALQCMRHWFQVLQVFLQRFETPLQMFERLLQALLQGFALQRSRVSARRIVSMAARRCSNPSSLKRRGMTCGGWNFRVTLAKGSGI